MDCFRIGKGVHQGCKFLHCLFKLYAEYIKQNTRLDESQSGIKIVERNINNLRWADNTTLMAESEEELRTSWGWKRILKKLAWTFKILRSWDPVPSLHDKKKGKTWKQWQIFFFFVSKITADKDCSHEIKRCLVLERKAMTNLDNILKSRDITLPTKVHQVKAMVFLVAMYGS